MPDLDLQKLIGHYSVYQEVTKYMNEEAEDDTPTQGMPVKYDRSNVENVDWNGDTLDHPFPKFLTKPAGDGLDEQINQRLKKRKVEVSEHELFDDDEAKKEEVVQEVEEVEKEDDDDDVLFLDDEESDFDFSEDEEDACSDSSVEEDGDEKDHGHGLGPVALSEDSLKEELPRPLTPHV